MIFGHNTNVKVGDATFHVQTEDRGESHALIDTTVYCQGRVLHRRTHNYFDLMPLNDDTRHALKLRLDDQHRVVLEEIRSGKLHLVVPAAPPPRTVAPAAKPAAAAPRKLTVDLLNPRSWLNGKQASLLLSVKDDSGAPVPNAKVVLQVEGGADTAEYRGQTSASGQVQIEFSMPKITAQEAAFVIRAEEGQASGQLRFSLRAKPKVPSV
jgi:Macroglobulin domain MG4